VLVELRDPYDTIVDLRAALLLDNGQVVDTNFLPGIYFEHVGPGNYYVVVKHRNHMPVMTEALYFRELSMLAEVLALQQQLMVFIRKI